MAKTFTVTHPKLYMKVDGKMKHILPDTEIKKHGESLRKQGKVLVKGENKSVNVGDKKPKDDESNAL